MENLSMEELLKMQEDEFKDIKIGEVVTAKISKINKDEVILHMNFGFDGVINIQDLNLPKGSYIEDIYKVDDEITGIITKIQNKDGIIYISKLMLDKQNDFKELEDAFKNKKILTVNTTKSIERGIFANYKTQEIFIPISQLDTRFVQKTKDYEGKFLEVYIKEISKNKLVASHREVLQERIDKEKEERRLQIEKEKKERKEQQRIEKERRIQEENKRKEDLFNSLSVGQKTEGRVTKIVDYGAFVDIGGIEGLLHKNNLSWEKVDNIQDLIKENQEVQVYVLDINKEDKKFALALKDINNDPWEIIKNEISINSLVTGEVIRIIEKGAFIKIREGVDAFLPLSEVSEERVGKISNIINVGDTITTMVIDFKPKNRRLVVSLKEANKEPEEDYSEFLQTEDSLGSLGDLFKDKFKNLTK